MWFVNFILKYVVSILIWMCVDSILLGLWLVGYGELIVFENFIVDVVNGVGVEKLL